MIPILTNVAVALPGIFVGSFLIEVFFSIPGLGREVLLAVNRSDYPVIQAVDDLPRGRSRWSSTCVTDVLYQAGRSAGGAEMSAGAWSPRRRRRRAAGRRAPKASGPRPGGASRRPRRHGLAARSCVAFLLLIAARRARLGRRATGRPRRACRMRRRPSSARPPKAAGRDRRRRSGPHRRHVAPSTRSRRATREWAERAAQFQTTEPRKADDAALRRRPARPRRARQGDQGRADLDPRRRARRRCSPRSIGTVLGALGRLLRRQGRRLPRVGLQRLHRDPRHPADLRVRGGARPRHAARSC